MISMALMSHSHHQCKLAKLLMIYFRSCGLSAKAFDTLHALGITMSQKWVYQGIDTLARQQQVLLLEDIKKYLWFGIHDNINIPFRAFQQRIGNQNHFDSGTAATMIRWKRGSTWDSGADGQRGRDQTDRNRSGKEREERKSATKRVGVIAQVSPLVSLCILPRVVAGVSP